MNQPALRDACDQLGSLGTGTTNVTISIGGNDIGWSHVLERCALPWPFTCWGDIDSADAFITGTLHIAVVFQAGPCLLGRHG